MEAAVADEVDGKTGRSEEMSIVDESEAMSERAVD